MSMECGTENTWSASAGWLDTTLTSLGEVTITGDSSNDILQNSRMQVYKVLSA